MVEEVPCRIYIESEDPYGLAGVNREKMQKSQMARYKVTKKYSDALENKDQWCIAAVPSYAWAKKVFPNEAKNKAYNFEVMLGDNNTITFTVQALTGWDSKTDISIP